MKNYKISKSLSSTDISKGLLIALTISMGITVPNITIAQTDPAVVKLGKEFVSDTIKVNGTTLRYVRGGTGPAIILVHGFPQDWYEFHKIMPRLARNFTVIAVDLRGVGGSAAAQDGFDAANLAKDIHQLVQKLELQNVYVVGHDIGGWVSYAFARLYPKATRGAMVLETLLPGIVPWDEVMADPRLWHVTFHQLPDLPEELVKGRQATYFRHFFDIGTLDSTAISDADVKHYADAYAGRHLQAAFETYRAIPANKKFNTTRRSAIEVSLVLAGGEHVFGPFVTALAETLQTGYGWTDIQTEIIENGGHYVVEEQPEVVAKLIEQYAGVEKGLPDKG